jgi:hypothetical protein
MLTQASKRTQPESSEEIIAGEKLAKLNNLLKLPETEDINVRIIGKSINGFDCITQIGHKRIFLCCYNDALLGKLTINGVYSVSVIGPDDSVSISGIPTLVPNDDAIPFYNWNVAVGKPREIVPIICFECQISKFRSVELLQSDIQCGNQQCVPYCKDMSRRHFFSFRVGNQDCIIWDSSAHLIGISFYNRGIDLTRFSHRLTMEALLTHMKCAQFHGVTTDYNGSSFLDVRDIRSPIFES